MDDDVLKQAQRIVDAEARLARVENRGIWMLLIGFVLVMLVIAVAAVAELVAAVM